DPAGGGCGRPRSAGVLLRLRRRTGRGDDRGQPADGARNLRGRRQMPDVLPVYLVAFFGFAFESPGRPFSLMAMPWGCGSSVPSWLLETPDVLPCVSSIWGTAKALRVSCPPSSPDKSAEAACVEDAPPAPPPAGGLRSIFARTGVASAWDSVSPVGPPDASRSGSAMPWLLLLRDEL